MGKALSSGFWHPASERLSSAANRACLAEAGIQSGIMFRVARGPPLSWNRWLDRACCCLKVRVCPEPARCGASGPEITPLGVKTAGRKALQSSISDRQALNQLWKSQCRTKCLLSRWYLCEALRARMRAIVHVYQLGLLNRRIVLSSRKRGMPQQFLNRSKVTARL